MLQLRPDTTGETGFSSEQELPECSFSGSSCSELNPNTPDTTGETGFSSEQELPENEHSGTETRKILGRAGWRQ